MLTFIITLLCVIVTAGLAVGSNIIYKKGTTSAKNELKTIGGIGMGFYSFISVITFAWYIQYDVTTTHTGLWLYIVVPALLFGLSYAVYAGDEDEYRSYLRFTLELYGIWGGVVILTILSYIVDRILIYAMTQGAISDINKETLEAVFLTERIPSSIIFWVIFGIQVATFIMLAVYIDSKQKRIIKDKLITAYGKDIEKQKKPREHQRNDERQSVWFSFHAGEDLQTVRDFLFHTGQNAHPYASYSNIALAIVTDAQYTIKLWDMLDKKGISTRIRHHRDIPSKQDDRQTEMACSFFYRSDKKKFVQHLKQNGITDIQNMSQKDVIIGINKNDRVTTLSHIYHGLRYSVKYEPTRIQFIHTANKKAVE